MSTETQEDSNGVSVIGAEACETTTGDGETSATVSQASTTNKPSRQKKPNVDIEMPVTWADVAVEDDVVVIKGVNQDQLSAKTIREVCGRSSLKISGVTNAPMKEMIARIRDCYQIRSSYKAAVPAADHFLSAADKIRLINIAHSDRHFEEWLTLYESLNRQQLDRGKEGHHEDFWRNIASHMGTEDEEFDVIVFDDDAFRGISLSPRPGIPWASLRDAWKRLTKQYKDCLKNFKLSGNHDPNFHHFTHGDPVPFYFHQWAVKRPIIKDTIVADIPEASRVDSSTMGSGCAPTQEMSRGKRKTIDQFVDLFGRVVPQPDPAAEAAKVEARVAASARAEKRLKLDEQVAKEKAKCLRQERKSKQQAYWRQLSDDIRHLERQEADVLPGAAAEELDQDIDRLRDEKERLEDEMESSQQHSSQQD
eukprot:GHVU01068803.1.p1 GENE.GHVU01068803.1~~GHVU01068803.1.p1  ORF type:complete len:422 (-),score=85.67 GHVU01068803.1:643-1908(-)